MCDALADSVAACSAAGASDSLNLGVKRTTDSSGVLPGRATRSWRVQVSAHISTNYITRPVRATEHLRYQVPKLTDSTPLWLLGTL
jgi:hypothetical protein